MTAEIGRRLPRNPGWPRFFLTALFATAYYAVISNTTAAVAGQRRSSNNSTVAMNLGLIILDFKTRDSGGDVVQALCIFTIMFVYDHIQLMLPREGDSNRDSSFWRMISNLLKILDKKDINSHIFSNDRVGHKVRLANMKPTSPSGRKLLFPQEDDSQSNPSSFWRRIMNRLRSFYRKDLKWHALKDDEIGDEVHLANMYVIRPSTFFVQRESLLDSLQSPTSLSESLWIQPKDLLR
ncbi:unnamed protein product [Linum tenue]|uniref:Uncharacterized protein n=1 Tax=Linum tenue TaxID=586396 RepID=A0AAV0LWZ6_9ROSI|nr:unnamed protein product [Linum tenue]